MDQNGTSAEPPTKDRSMLALVYSAVETLDEEAFLRVTGAFSTGAKRTRDPHRGTLRVRYQETIRSMPQPFRLFDYVLCVMAFFLVGFAIVPLMTAWIR